MQSPPPTYVVRFPARAVGFQLGSSFSKLCPPRVSHNTMFCGYIDRSLGEHFPRRT